MLHPPAHLHRAVVIGAAQGDLALDLDHGAPAGRAAGRKHEWGASRGPPRGIDADDGGDHLAGLLHENVVAHAYVLPGDLVAVVQGRARHRCAREENGLELGNGGEDARAAHLDRDRQAWSRRARPHTCRPSPSEGPCSCSRPRAGGRANRASPRRRRSRRRSPGAGGPVPRRRPTPRQSRGPSRISRRSADPTRAPARGSLTGCRRRPSRARRRLSRRAPARGCAARPRADRGA